ncbi:MAG: hypothetical protein K940chlam8_01042 [Chlamydiae bacterium]|nr:hypothetical protein [Chlamydiota bacterium]
MGTTAIAASDISTETINTDLRYWETKDGAHNIAWGGLAAFILGGATVIIGRAEKRNVVIGGAIALAGAIASLYFSSGKYYHDPKARTEYNKELTSGQKTLEEFIQEHGFENIRTFGFEILEHLIVTREQIKELFFKQNPNLLLSLYDRKSLFIQLLKNEVFDSQELCEMEREFILNLKRSDDGVLHLFLLTDSINEAGFNQTPSMKKALSWIEKTREQFLKQAASIFTFKELDLPAHYFDNRRFSSHFRHKNHFDYRHNRMGHTSEIKWKQEKIPMFVSHDHHVIVFRNGYSEISSPFAMRSITLQENSHLTIKGKTIRLEILNLEGGKLHFPDSIIFDFSGFRIQGGMLKKIIENLEKRATIDRSRLEQYLNYIKQFQPEFQKDLVS